MLGQELFDADAEELLDADAEDDEDADEDELLSQEGVADDVLLLPLGLMEDESSGEESFLSLSSLVESVFSPF